MTTIEITGDELIVHVAGLDRLWSFKSELRVALAHVSGAKRATEEARRWWHGFRAPGTHLPGMITAGTFYDGEGRVFWDVHDADRAIAIELHDDRFAKLVVEVADPDAIIAAIDASVRQPAGTGDSSGQQTGRV